MFNSDIHLKQSISNAKVRQRTRVILAAIFLVAVLIFCILILVFVSPDQSRQDIDSELTIPPTKPDINPVADEQLRQQFLDELSEYENTLKPELGKIDLNAWNQERSQKLDLLKDKALSEFADGDYGPAVATITSRNQLANSTISDSRKAFQKALSNAQHAYQADQYDEAKLQITQALMLDKSSDTAIRLADKIDTMPDLLRLVEQINTARIENNPRKELKLVNELLAMAPDRTSAEKRKQILENRIRQSSFKTAIAQTYQALKRGDIQTAQRKINMAKAIFPLRQEVNDASVALQKLAKQQRLIRYRTSIEDAIADDNWQTVKQQATLAIQDHSDDKTFQESLKTASAIVTLANTFEISLKHPYRLANQELVTKLNNKLATANTFSELSPSLTNQAKQLSDLIKQMNNKIQVNVLSDNQTSIHVRGIGKIGKTELKTLHLLPGEYMFEGKRKGFKSKLVEVLIPYDTTSFQVEIRCDEPI